MMYSGECLTLNTSEPHNTVRELSLSDFFEENVDPKYYLSEEKTTKLFSSDCIAAYTKRRTKATRHDFINTIIASYHGVGSDGAPGIIEEGKARRLTPVECERCQMFPDNWTKFGKDDEHISDSRRYHMCGNAVCVSMMKAVFLALFEVICNEGQGIATKSNEVQIGSSTEFSQ